MSKPTQDESQGGWLNHTGIHLGIMALVMAFLFLDSFRSGLVVFSNDGPLGNQMAQWDYLYQNFTGLWNPLNWFGNEAVANRPTISILVGILMQSAVVYQKFFCPFALWCLGASAYFCFRQLGLRKPVCFIAATAVMLNMNGFSRACWGLPYWDITRAMAFLALGLVACQRIRNEWIRYALAGACIGMGVMEGYDIGAIFSVFMAAVIFAYLDTRLEGPVAQRFLKGALAVIVVAFAATIVAAHAVVSLVNTQVKGVAVAGQTKDTSDRAYQFATQWSLPKLETLRFVIPGLFGYRMDEENGGQYWGRVGRSPQIPELQKILANPGSNPGVKAQAQQMLASPQIHRYSGSGEHLGVLVALIAFWAFVLSFARKGTSFNNKDRYFIWCLAAFALIALLLSYGRYGFLYRFFFELPYAETVRNPIKFTQPMHMALGIIFAFGLNDLWVRFVDRERTKPGSFGDWWHKLPVLDRNWFLACGAMVGISLMSLMLYASKRSAVEGFMKNTAIEANAAKVVFDFSLAEVVIFIFFLVCSVVAFALIHRGTFMQRQAKWGAAFMLFILVFDLGRSNAHFIKHIDYKQEYADNPVFQKLSAAPHEGRVTMGPGSGVPLLDQLANLYRVNWLHKQFPYYQIQSLDISQESRVGQDKTDYLANIQSAPLRMWELAGARYFLGINSVPTAQGNTRYTDFLNKTFDPVGKRFRNTMEFGLYQPPGTKDLQIVVQSNAPLVLIEFAGALPRAKLFHQWQTHPGTNAFAVLKSPTFNPQNSVVIDGSMPPPTATPATGSAVIKTYEPKRVVIEAETSATAVLLLNDRYDEDWNAYVDGKPVKVMRANYIARGIKLDPGKHQVEFRFEPPVNALYISLLGLLATIVTAGLTLYGKKSELPVTDASEPEEDFVEDENDDEFDEKDVSEEEAPAEAEPEQGRSRNSRKRKGKRRR